MEFTEINREEKEPYIQLLLLGIFVVIGLFAGPIIGVIIDLCIYGFDLIHNTGWMSGKDLKYVNALKIVLFTSQIGTFMVPALVLSLIEGKKPAAFYGLKRPSIPLLLLVLCIMACALPLIGYTTELNQKMHLPSFLKGLEHWMQRLEDEGETTMNALLNMKSKADLLLGIFLVAVVPAVCEELLFRGALQRTLLRMKINPHVAIWIGAAIFSAFHLQFFGFLPRMLLGAALGYIYFFTGSLWYGIFAHFLNNTYAVIVMYYYQLNNLSIKEAEKQTIPLYATLISAILTLALFKLLKDRSANPKPNDAKFNLPQSD